MLESRSKHTKADMKWTVKILFLWICLVVKSTSCQVYCPGELVSIPCTARPPVVWRGSALVGQCADNYIRLMESLTADNISNTFVCGNFTVILTSVTEVTVTAFTSSLSFNATTSFDGANIVCTDGITNASSVQFQVPDVPTPTLTTNQISLTSVTVSLNVDDDQCAAMYFIEIFQDGGNDPNITMSGPTSVFNVPDLDLCSYRYIAVGYTQASSGVQGIRSSPFSIPVDLSVLQGVMIVTTTPASLTWNQLPNTQSQCITHYTLSWPDGGQLNTTNATTSISAMQLIDAGFPYCQALPVTVTPQTPVGPVTGGSGSTDVIFEYQGLQGVTNVTSTLSMLEWDQLPNSQSQCITHYTLSWSDGGQYVTTDTNTSVSAMVLNSAGFAYCQTLPVTVTPQTPFGPLSRGNGSVDVTFHRPHFTVPMLTTGFTLQNESVQLRVALQNISEDIVQNRMYGYSRGGMSCTPKMTFTGSLLTISLPGAMAGDSVTACVMFQNMDCVAMNTSTSNVPDTSAPTVSGGQTTRTDYQVTITLPTTSFSPSDLLIIASLSPGNIEPIINDFPTSSLTHSVTFTGLNSGTSYTYSIRIVLRNDNNIIVVAPSTGCFTILSNLSQLSCGTAIALSVILTFLLTLVLGISIGVVSVLVYNKCKRGTDQSSSQPTELTTMTGPVYEEPVDFKPDPHTAGNVAYGHVQPVLHPRQ